MNPTQFLLNFADKIEQKELVNQSTAIRMRNYIRRLEDATPIELFLIVSGIMGALFCSAGIFSIISHNWDSYPKYVRGIFSVVPAVVGLYFYYRAVFYHSKSRPWIEASSVFLMLMIGASIALVSQTYQLDGDFNKFIKVWAVLTLPLFYFARASGITILYLGLITGLAVDISLGFLGFPKWGDNDHDMWYWLLLLGFLPHYYLALKKNSRAQSIRITYMSYVVYLSLLNVLWVTVEGNFILWVTTIGAGFYLIGKRFMGENENILARPFQLMSQLSIVSLLVFISNKSRLLRMFNEDSFVHLFKEKEEAVVSLFAGAEVKDEKMFYFILLIILLTAIYFVYFYFRKHFKDVSKLILFAPVFMLLMMVCHEYIFPDWLIVLMINAYILFIGFGALIVGNENKNIAQMIYGFMLISLILWLRYFDTDWNFILKGLSFIGIGAMFFLINLTQKSKLERIERNKTRRDDY